MSQLELIFGIGIIVGSIVLIGGLHLWRRYREKRDRASWPPVWEHHGEPPPGYLQALRVIEERAPGLPAKGRIYWRTEPWYDMGRRVAGILVTTQPVTVEVLYDVRIERTALAHELGHAWYALTKGKVPEPSQDAEFAAWLRETNAAIAQSLGRTL